MPGCENLKKFHPDISRKARYDTMKEFGREEECLHCSEIQICNNYNSKKKGIFKIDRTRPKVR